MVAPYLIQLSRTLAALTAVALGLLLTSSARAGAAETTAPGCFGAQPTKVGTAKHDYIKGTPGGT